MKNAANQSLMSARGPRRSLPALAMLCVVALLVQRGTAFAASMNFGDSWLRLQEGDRIMWVWGAAEGQLLLSSELDENVKSKLTTRIDNTKAESIAGIMTQIYRDPANAYIPWRWIALMASDKLRGVPREKIESDLESLRQAASK